MIYVITNVDCGWDCVFGVFKTEEGVKRYFEERGIDYDDVENGETSYIIHRKQLFE